MFGLTLGKFFVLIIMGAIAGSLAGRVVTLSSRGFGRWTNLAIGMIGAVIGNIGFYMLHIDLGLGDLKISVEDLIAAFAGSLFCIVSWWLLRMFIRRKRNKASAI